MDPFKITGPACVSFSGGRTSGYMLRRILDAHGGPLPSDVHVLFANTGKERPETLDFVRDCGERWGVRIVWLEYDGRDGKRAFREVTYETAARDGEPFAELIRRKSALPNGRPGQRWCTSTLKVNRIRAFMRSRGYEGWTDAVGLRADEPRRVARRRSESDDEVNYALPLADSGVTADDVRAFWRAQPFDLLVRPGGGNCDLCFMKGARLLREQIAADPDAAAWWLAREEQTGRTFSTKWTYAELQATALVPVERLTGRQLALALNDEPAMPCGCTE